MNSDKVLVAFDSPVMTSFVSKILTEECGFDVITAKDGVAALDIVCTEMPVCVFVYLDLPYINGWNFSRIIKNTQQLKNIGVVICADETTGVYSFWKEKSNADNLLSFQNINAEKLTEIVNASVSKNKNFLDAESEGADTEQTKKTGTLDRSEIVKLVAEASDRELFNLYMVQSAYDVGTAAFGVEQIADAMVKDLMGICKYDAIGIIINGVDLIERYDHARKMTRDEMDDFENICHKDFESKIRDRKEYDWTSSTIKRTRFENENRGNSKIKSYITFPTGNTTTSPVTVHVASCEIDAFNSRINERLNFFTHVYAKIIAKNLRFIKVVETEKNMRRAFSRFVPDVVIDEIVSGNEAVQTSIGEKRHVAIMMLDIRNFTTISEINEPEDVVNFLNYFFSVMGAIIRKHGGTIDKFMGDAIMALFGAPESFDDNGNRAAHAAMEIMEAMKTINTRNIVMPKFYKFAIGIGIHYGMPIVGSIGSEDKRDYTVIGDDVNLASRVEGLTKIYGIPVLVTETIKQDLRGGERTRLLDRVKVKGKQEPIEIYELIYDMSKYTDDFLSAYNKGVKQYLLGNFNGAIDYFKQAINIKVDDKASHVLLGRCKDFLDNPPLVWEGAVALQNK